MKYEIERNWGDGISDLNKCPIILGGGIWKTVKNKENGTDLIQELSEYG
jgi:hypothetical protein